MSTESFDIIVIGGGPGGYVAAIRAAQLGLRTAIVERRHLGGICLNWGCIPAKSLLRSAEVYREIRHAADYGLSVEGASFDITRIVERSRNVAKRLSGGIAFLMKKNKIKVIEGEASLTGPTSVAVSRDGQAVTTLEAKHVILATGARPRVLPGLEPDGHLVWTYFEALTPKALPQSLLIVGSGAIGVEFASFYRTLGAEVTVVELQPQILPAEDAEIAALARKSFEKQGIRILAGSKVVSLDRQDSSVTATIENAAAEHSSLTVERVISAVGVTGNVEGLGLEALGVALRNGCIVADGMGRTNVPGLYAIGDVAGPPMLAHKAEHEGVVCVEAIAGLSPHALDKNHVPGATFCHPQVASVGLTEAAAVAAGQAVRIGRFPFLANGKAIAHGDDQGLVKVILDAGDGSLLGAHMIGPEVTEMIHGFAQALAQGLGGEALLKTIYPHPTLSETMHEGVLAALGRALHV